VISVLRSMFLACATAVSAAWGAPLRVDIPAPAAESAVAHALPAYWFGVEGDVPRPALVLLHGCGGALDRRGGVSAHLVRYADWANARGWHALVVDSLSGRGERELCTQPMGTRAVTQRERRLDTLAALQWLAARPQVDAGRIALAGWSHGGSAVLAAGNLRAGPVRQAAVRPRALVAFYPGCSAEQRRGYVGSAPLLVLMGEADDWTPPEPCRALARDAEGVELVLYPGAFHAFDGVSPLRVRRDVPNGVRPGEGVHVGADPVAREAALAALEDFLQRHLGAR
jgi:dienelactone hydrolase